MSTTCPCLPICVWRCDTATPHAIEHHILFNNKLMQPPTWFTTLCAERIAFYALLKPTQFAILRIQHTLLLLYVLLASKQRNRFYFISSFTKLDLCVSCVALETGNSSNRILSIFRKPERLKRESLREFDSLWTYKYNALPKTLDGITNDLFRSTHTHTHKFDFLTRS